MMWIILYAATALVVGVALFVLAEFRREPGTPAPQWPGACAMAAGFLWPALLVGAVQCVLVVAVGRRVGHAASPSGGRTRIAHPVG